MLQYYLTHHTFIVKVIGLFIVCLFISSCHSLHNKEFILSGPSSIHSMASTSSSSIQKSFKYDVFLSFRGEDTRKNFVDNLYHALKQKGIYTYKDDEEIKKGKAISDELIRSIEDSKCYIIVFSKNYASSSWCLNELVKIMECQKTNEQIAYPVFYDVEPTEVRNQSGAVLEAFAKHVNKEAAGRWRDALKEAAGLAGWELKNTFDGHEAKFIQKIVEEVSRELCFIKYNVDGKLVGMETRVKDVVTSLETDIYDVRMIGIKGMGGVGKTTLARVVFNQISFQFEGSSFVENVRENSKNLMCGLKSLQKQVLSDVLNEQNITVTDVYEGKIIMKQRMSGRKVLVVLDDVDHIDQLEALAGEPSWFKPGSRVIITTREEQVLVAHGVPMNMIFDVNLLSHMEANCLFSRYAFGREVPTQGYAELSSQVVRYAAGLPLTIKVLGSFLRGKNELEWTDALERLKTIPLKETLEILELSYYGLEEDCKEIFLDVACILKDWEKERAIRALESCDFHARSGLRVLEQKSLITLSSDGCLGMHDHIVEMGKNIVRRLYPNMPYRHSRLWIREEIEDIFVEDKGTEATRCMAIRMIDLVILMRGLRKMNELRFLEVSGYLNHNIDEDSLHLPNSLRYLCWHDYPLTCLPKNFLANNLVGLEMHWGHIDQLWKGEEKKVLKKIRFIDFSYCKLRTLDIGLTMNLERLSLEKCSNLVELHMPINNKLKFLSIGHCQLIRTLDLEQAHNLDTLKVTGCEDLVELHMPTKNFKLKFFSISQCKVIRTLNLVWAQNLDTLKVVECMDLVELNMPIESKLKFLSITHCQLIRTLDLERAHNLDTLKVTRCEDLVELHMPIESCKLKFLSIGHCKLIRTLDLVWAQNLDSLKVEECKDLVELHMPTKNFKLKFFSISHCKAMRTLGLVWAQNLDTLKVVECRDLEELHMPIESKLKFLSIDHCQLIRTLDLERAHNLDTLKVTRCEDLVELHLPIKSCKLKFLSIGQCKLIRTLDLVWAQNLDTLKVEKCKDLVELYMPVESIKLKHLSLQWCKLKTLNLMWTPDLEMLDLVCDDLVELHMPVEIPKLKHLSLQCFKLKTLNLRHAHNLETLDLVQCKDLVELYMPVENFKLKSIHFYCSKMRTLDLGWVKDLEKLSITKCEVLVELPLAIGKIKKLILCQCSKLKTIDLTRTRNLEMLYLEECKDLVELHMPIETLELKIIEIYTSKLRTLNLTQTRNLKQLHLFQCEDLLDVHMPIESHDLESVIIDCSKLRTLQLGLCPYLQRLYVYNCYNLVEIYAPVGCLSGSVRFKPCLVNQGFPMKGSLAELHLIARSIGICPLHPDNNLPRFHFECIYNELPLSYTQNLVKLISLGLCACTNLASLSRIICRLQLRKLTLEGSIPEVPKELDQLESLKELSLLSTNIEHFPDSIFMLKDLKFLRFESCWFLKRLPENIGRLECLEELHVTGCTSLRDIPNSICEMKRLKCFHLTNCILVEKLPKEIGRLKCLKELNIQGTSIRDFPLGIFEVEDLLFLF